MALSGDAFHRAILTSSPSDRPNVLTQFKTHVKKDNVDLASVPRYFEALLIAMKLLDPELQSLAFSLACHLVKRVSIQDRHGSILVNVAPVVLPMLIPKLADVRSTIKLSARRALEAYWLSAPDQTERAVVELGLERGTLLANESVVWLNSILLINANIDLHPFFPALAQVLSQNSNDGKLISNIKILFANYFDLKHNSLHRFDLQKVLESKNVSTALRTSIIGTDAALLREYSIRNKISHNIPNLSTSSSAATASKQGLREAPAPKPAVVPTTKPVIDAKPTIESSSENKELDQLLKSLTGYPLEEGIKPAPVDNEEELLHIFSSFAPIFEGKETEKNWSHREKAIHRVRTLLRSDVGAKYPQTFFLAIKDMSEMICKGLLSLRTSLCLSSCQLVKELALLQNDFLVLFDLFWPTLIRLCSSTKHLTSINAHVVVSAIFANTIITTKSAQKIFLSSKEKSASVRCYSAFWLQIYMLRSYKLWPVPPSCEVVENILIKLLSDPNVQVRQAAKDAFWRYYILAVDAATVLQSKLDSNTVKALERSRPKNCHQAAPVTTARNSRTSIKEAIIAKNKELRNQQTVSRSNSRNGYYSRTPSLPIDTSVELSSNAPSVNSAASHVRKISSNLKDEDMQQQFAQGASHLVSALSSKASGVRSSGLHETNQPNTVPQPNSLPKRFNNLPVLESLTSPDEEDADAIAALLASKGTQQIENGMKMVSTLFIKNKPISSKLQSSITLVSISHPHLFSVILVDKGQSAQLFKYLSAEDFLRTCFVAIAEPNECYSVVSSCLNTEQICHSITSILGYICNMDEITGNKPLVMQLIKSKGTILAVLIDVLSRVANIDSHSPVLPKMLSILFGLVPIVYQTHIIDPYRNLLQCFYDRDQNVFLMHLDLATPQNKNEVCNLLGIGPKINPNKEESVTLNPSEFTLIAPGTSASSFLPLKHPSDFTMLFPSKLSPAKETLHPSTSSSNVEDVVKKESDSEGDEKSMQCESPESCIEDINQEPVTNEAAYTYDNSSTNNESSKDESTESNEKAPTPVPSILFKESEKSFLNIFAKSDSRAMNSEFVAKLNSDPARDLVEDFAQVKLSNFSNSIESFIEKVDPLNRMSTRSRPIAIFEDPKGGSPQKVKDYSYTEYNWFNFLIARLSVIGGFVEEKESIDIICHDMERGLLTNSQLSTLLEILQKSQKSKTGLTPLDFIRVETSLLAFLEVPASDKLIGLMILKQLLVCRHQLKLENVWMAIAAVCESILSDNDQEYVMELALREVFGEMLCGMYSSAELFQTIFSTFHTPNDLLDQLTHFLVDALYQLLESNTLVLLVTEELVFKLDTVLRPFMKHDSARVRKATFKTYGLFLKACKAIDRTTENPSGERPSAYHCMLDVMQALTTPDRKLVEYYSKD